MTEWGVFLVIAALVSFIVAIITPMIKLNTTITKLTIKLDHLEKVFTESVRHTTKATERLWSKNDEQDKILGDHERRIQHIEDKEEMLHGN